ncbi:unnamed protein product [Linum tenue]|uniref:Secreted protein n=1 Tax=Linum tenue TaxID=586396 RepID=A0AAV0NDY1_9ROSI|nr:unnamed protein product [Linum tenue]
MVFQMFIIIIFRYFARRSWIFILGDAFDTCINQSSYCKNCCWLFGSCATHSAVYCQELDASRTLHWIHCVSCYHLGITRIHQSTDPSICYSLHWYKHPYQVFLFPLFFN